MPELVCLTLHAPRALGDRLSDFLLENEKFGAEFSASDVRFHGTDLGQRTMAEQIQGHARQIEVKLIISAAEADQLLIELGSEFPACGLSYWIGPAKSFGVIG